MRVFACCGPAIAVDALMLAAFHQRIDPAAVLKSTSLVTLQDREGTG